MREREEYVTQSTTVYRTGFVGDDGDGRDGDRMMETG